MSPVRILGASAAYSLALVATGWLLGPLRVLLIEPRVGPVVAVWMEAPLMALAIMLAAHWISRLFSLGRSMIARLEVGLLALLLVIAAEIIGGQLMRGRSIMDTLEGWIAPAGWPLIGLYLLLLLAPWLLGSSPTDTVDRSPGAGSGPAHFPREPR